MPNEGTKNSKVRAEHVQEEADAAVNHKGSTLPVAYAPNIFLFIDVTQCPPKKDDKTPCVAVTNQKRFGSLMFNHVLFFPQEEFNRTESDNVIYHRCTCFHSLFAIKKNGKS